MRVYIFLMAFAFSLTASSSSQPLSLVLGSPKVIEAGMPFQLDMLFVDETGSAIENFELNHEKLNHTILVSQDLASLAHIHPELNTGGRFSLLINGSGYDADNLDAQKAVPTPGKYLVISEVIPFGQTSATVARSEFTTEGIATPVALVVDPTVQGVRTKYFTQDGKLGALNDYYKVSLTIHAMTGMVHFTFKVEENMNHGGTNPYMPIQTIENWLGMPGHAILVSETGSTADEKFFKHLHLGHSGHKAAFKGLTGDHLEFVISGSEVPPAGVYKIWAQFKHKGQILTFPFVFKI